MYGGKPYGIELYGGQPSYNETLVANPAGPYNFYMGVPITPLQLVSDDPNGWASTLDLISGSLPPGLSFDYSLPRTDLDPFIVTISGTPTTLGSYPLSFENDDSYLSPAQLNITIDVLNPNNPPDIMFPVPGCIIKSANPSLPLVEFSWIPSPGMVSENLRRYNIQVSYDGGPYNDVPGLTGGYTAYAATSHTFALSGSGEVASIRIATENGINLSDYNYVTFNVELHPTISIPALTIDVEETFPVNAIITVPQTINGNPTIVKVKNIVPVPLNFFTTHTLYDNNNGTWTFNWVPSIGTYVNQPYTINFEVSEVVPLVTETVANIPSFGSNSFVNGGAINNTYWDDTVSGGSNFRPEVHWDSVYGAVEYAILMIDTDIMAPDFIHWMVTNIPFGVTNVPSAYGDADLIYTRHDNEWPYLGYGGPAGLGGHVYEISLYALNSSVYLPQNCTKAQFDAAINGRVIAMGTWTGVA